MSFLSFLWTPRHVASEEGILHPLPLSLPSLAWQKTFKALHGAKAGVLHLSLSSRPLGSLSAHAGRWLGSRSNGADDAQGAGFGTVSVVGTQAFTTRPRRGLWYSEMHSFTTLGE